MLRFLPREPEAPTKEALAALTPYTGVMARLLYARGITDARQAERFLHPAREHFHDPFLLNDMARTVELLSDAKEKNISTVVYGDYDVDGMCATALLCDALRRFGLEATPHIPLREEGYGLSLAAVEKLAQEHRLLVTVDLGITNHTEVRHAQELGMTVIVTDHHQLALERNPADAVLSPLLGGYPCPKLCGAGVALKLAQALLGMEAAEEYLDLAALATVADIVPLVGENRAIVALGLPMISALKREGIRALMEVSGVHGQADSFTLGFQLAPRLNAAGRLKNANDGARLLMTADAAEADAIARSLNQLNIERKKKESEVLAEAEQKAQMHNFAEERALIVRGVGWHMGVVGLVAGRLCRRYACPTAVLSEEDGVLRGSLRSVPGVNIHKCLQACEDLLLRYGGHEQAAGVTLLAVNYAAFSDRLQHAIRAAASDEAFVPTCTYDLPLSFQGATEQLANDIARLAPFGCENPSPLFLAKNVMLARRRACGADGTHLQITLREGKHMLDGIAFGMGGMAALMPDRVDAVISLKLDTFRGVTAVKCEAEAICPAQGALRTAVARAEAAEFETGLLAALTELREETKKAGEKEKNLEILNVTENSAKDEENSALTTKATTVHPTVPPPSRGVLYVARTRESAQTLLAKTASSIADLCWHSALDPLCFPTLLLCPRLSSVQGGWRKVVLLDGELVRGEAALWKAKLPQAEIIALVPTAPLETLAASLDAGDKAYRMLYRLLRTNAFPSLAAAAKAAGLSPAQAHAGMIAFSELCLLSYGTSPFSYTLLPPVPCKLDDSPALGALRSLSRRKKV